jgi:hypothetical protein
MGKKVILIWAGAIIGTCYYIRGGASFGLPHPATSAQSLRPARAPKTYCKTCFSPPASAFASCIVSADGAEA